MLTGFPTCRAGGGKINLPGTTFWLPKFVTRCTKTPKETNNKVKQLSSFMSVLEIHLTFCGNLLLLF